MITLPQSLEQRLLDPRFAWYHSSLYTRLCAIAPAIVCRIHVCGLSGTTNVLSLNRRNTTTFPVQMIACNIRPRVPYRAIQGSHIPKSTFQVSLNDFYCLDLIKRPQSVVMLQNVIRAGVHGTHMPGHLCIMRKSRASTCVFRSVQNRDHLFLKHPSHCRRRSIDHVSCHVTSSSVCGACRVFLWYSVFPKSAFFRARCMFVFCARFFSISTIHDCSKRETKKSVLTLQRRQSDT